MRVALSILLAVGGGIFLMAMLTEEENRTPPDLRRAENGRNPRVVKPPSNDPVKLQGAHGTDVYAPRSAKAVIDGEEITYGTVLMWCRGFDAVSEERFEVRDVRLIANPKPKTKDDVARHVVVPRDTRPAHIGELLLDAMKEKKALGVHAQGAVFEGGRDLDTARRIFLKDGVVVYVVDPEDRTRTGEIHSETLELEVEQGHVVRGITKDKVTVQTAEGTIHGIGFSFEPATGVFRIESNISGQLVDLTLLGRRGPPATFTAGGPLLYEPRNPKSDRKSLRPAGAFQLNKDVVIKQGDFEVRGQKMHLTTGATRSELRGFVLEGDVSATTAEGTFAGGRITWATGPDGQATLTLGGGPIVATLANAGRALPGIGGRGDLEVSTDGTIVFNGLDRPEDVERTVTIGPEVVLQGKDGVRIDARMMSLHLLHVARNSASSDAATTKLYPIRIRLDGKVRGRGPSGSFSCRLLAYERTYDDHRPVLDRIELSGAPELLYVTARQGAPPPAPPVVEKTKFGDLLSGDGPLRIQADERLELRLDPLRVRPMIAEARGGVRVRRFDGAEPDQERGRLHAGEVDLEIEEVHSPDLTAPVIRFAGNRRVRQVVARKNVQVLVPDQLRGDGDLLTWQDDAGDLQLDRHGDRPAVVVVTDGQGREQTLRAPRLLYRRAGSSIHASGGVSADVRVPAISYGRGRTHDTVETHVTADTVTAWLKSHAAAGTEASSSPNANDVIELLAAGAVVVAQESGAGVKCEHMRIDLIREETIVRGSPARLDLIHVGDDGTYKEWVQAPSIAVTGGNALLTGPVSARLHARRKDVAMNVGSKTQDAAGPLLPVDITAGEDLFISEERIQARGGKPGGTIVEQGDPAVDGFRLTSERVLLLLGQTSTSRPPEGGGGLEGLDVRRAVITGNVTFKSPDIAATGDALEFSNREKIVMLYAHEKNATLTWRNDHQLPRPRFDLELSDPDNPRIISSLPPPRRDSP